MNNLKIYSFISHYKQDKKITFAKRYTTVFFFICGINMRFVKKYFLICNFLIMLLGILISCPIIAQEARFTVVLDAGHGGHDPGAMGSISREKDINLAVILELGTIIEKNYKEVKVIYTRTSDKYLTLQERADIVNENHADLFICIHTNAAQSSSAFGAETFTLGLAKTKANLDVAMRENSVILLEEDYHTKYKGFDPNSVDSYIMFEFMQDKYIDKSVEFSSIIQKQFVTYCRRSDRGVRQAGFWVLHRSACPSVLVELGFISNPAEERYLSSNQGQNEMASAVFNAFVEYKRTHDKKSGRQTTAVLKISKPIKTEDTSRVLTKQVIDEISVEREKPIKSEPAIDLTMLDKKSSKPVFKVQLFATTKTLKSNASDFKGVRNTQYFSEGGLNKYTLGSETDYFKIEKIRKDILSKFPEAFIIAFIDEEKLSAKETLKLIK